MGRRNGPADRWARARTWGGFAFAVGLTAMLGLAAGPALGHQAVHPGGPLPRPPKTPVPTVRPPMPQIQQLQQQLRMLHQLRQIGRPLGGATTAGAPDLTGTYYAGAGVAPDWLTVMVTPVEKKRLQFGLLHLLMNPDLAADQTKVEEVLDGVAKGMARDAARDAAKVAEMQQQLGGALLGELLGIEPEAPAAPAAAPAVKTVAPSAPAAAEKTAEQNAAEAKAAKQKAIEKDAARKAAQVAAAQQAEDKKAGIEKYTHSKDAVKQLKAALGGDTSGPVAAKDDPVTVERALEAALAKLAGGKLRKQEVKSFPNGNVAETLRTYDEFGRLETYVMQVRDKAGKRIGHDISVLKDVDIARASGGVLPEKSWGEPRTLNAKEVQQRDFVRMLAGIEQDDSAVKLDAAKKATLKAKERADLVALSREYFVPLQLGRSRVKTTMLKTTETGLAEYEIKRFVTGGITLRGY